MTAIAGTQITEAAFPRVTARRLSYAPAPSVIDTFVQEAGEHLDYSVDLSAVLNTALDDSREVIVSAWAESSVEDELMISAVGYARSGVVVWAYGGLDGTAYTLTITARTEFGRVLTFKAEITTVGNYADNLPTFTPPILGDPALDPAQHYLTDVLGNYLCPTWVDENGDLLQPNFGAP